MSLDVYKRQVLEQLINAAVLGTGSSAVSAFLLGHPWLYAVYGGLSAGILEETARFLVYLSLIHIFAGGSSRRTVRLAFAGRRTGISIRSRRRIFRRRRSITRSCPCVRSRRYTGC